MIKHIKELLVCKRKGHDWEMYIADSGCNSYYNHYDNIEQAGYCRRCGYDTHGQYSRKPNFAGRFLINLLRKLAFYYDNRNDFEKAEFVRKLLKKVWNTDLFLK